MPGSQIEARPSHNLDAFIGKDIPVKIVKLNRRRGNVVVSRKMAVEEEQHTRKSAALQVLEEGAMVTGIVKNLTDYGAFIDLGGIDGLLHVSDMSYGRDDASLRAGATPATRSPSRCSSSIARRSAFRSASNSWFPILGRTSTNGIHPASRVIGRVVSVTDYGAFVELEPGVEGLIHISEMTWSRRMKHPTKVVKVGDQVESVVLEVRSKRAPRLARHQAAGAGSVDHRSRALRHRLRGGRPRAQTHRFRRLRRNRGRASTGWCTSRTCPGPNA